MKDELLAIAEELQRVTFPRQVGRTYLNNLAGRLARLAHRNFWLTAEGTAFFHATTAWDRECGVEVPDKGIIDWEDLFAPILRELDGVRVKVHVCFEPVLEEEKK